MQAEAGYLSQLVTGLVRGDEGKYFISRASAALVLAEDAERDFGQGLSFDQTMDQVLAAYGYKPTDLRFGEADQAETCIPLDVAVGSWLRWAANGSDKAALIVSNLAIAGLIALFDTSLSEADNSSAPKQIK